MLGMCVCMCVSTQVWIRGILGASITGVILAIYSLNIWKVFKTVYTMWGELGLVVER